MQKGVFFKTSFNDYELFREKAKRWNLNHKKLDKGDFKVNLSVIDIGEVQITRTKVSCTIEQQGLTPGGYRTFVVPSDNKQEYIWYNKIVNSKHLGLFAKNGILDGVSYENFDVYTRSIRKDQLEYLLAYYQFSNLEKVIDLTEKVFSINSAFVY